ncbi:excinuclease ABC subunit UvrA [Porphyromonas pogonae]|uniref:excinuclease ABC subunit UvrA n=1 Tax=Porphyromonas pogonae TaxID=867595 RepID=UPI002E76AA92|nr:excinuclease ABC subunit UvrA [Porphyromonas pogonae]
MRTKEPSLHRVEPEKEIVIKGARVNNLKNIDLTIPRGQLVVITGVSGSGKSSLAFDTLYAEGQRRYVESLSAYARQFLGRMPKPECDMIKGIPPAIAIEQRVISRNPRSTVGTSTEIYEYMRLLFARIGQTISPESGEVVKKHTVNDLVNYAHKLPESTRIFVLVELVVPEGRLLKDHLEIQLQQGYSRVMVNGELVRISDIIKDNIEYDKSQKIYLLIDRIVVSSEEATWSRLADSAEGAFFEGRGTCILRIEKPDETKARTKEFSNIFEADGRVFQEPSPEMFSFNNPIGACPVCEGFGKVMGIDEDLVIPNKELSLYDGCVACWIGPKSQEWQKYFIRQSEPYNFPIHKPYEELTAEQKDLLWNGTPASGGKQAIEGINAYFDMLGREMHKIQNRVRLAHFRGKATCPACKGQRLKPDALCVKIDGKNISELTAMTITQAIAFFRNLKLTETEQIISKRLLIEINNRLQFLDEVGLSYLTIDRLSNTLSGGESQRITLATQLGSSLVGSLYVLDEPSIGLHQRDTARLIHVIERLKSLGNTVVVVEHDEEMMRAADYIIDIGPDAGRLGGEVVYAGAAKNINKNTPGYTAAYLTGREKLEIPSQRRKWNNFIEVIGAKKHNLKNINVKFPLNIISVITGVSGSGKSTLVRDIFFEGVQRLLSGEPIGALYCKDISGDVRAISNVQYVDQNNIGRSSRSNPATYVGAYDEIRKLYSELPLSKQMGYKPYYFSFNKEGGRCEACKGEGTITVEMQFMADIVLPCDECNGKRFRKEMLDVEFNGKNIYEILEMTVNEAIIFFNESSEKNNLCDKIVNNLKPLKEVGLGYIKLGQNSSTLSGGENQRVKLAYYLGQKKNEPTLFIFDEPTTGLHFHDIRTLMHAFNSLIAKGHTVVIVEHNLEVIKSADWVIDLGPEGGKDGGNLVVAGTPEEVVACKESFTGKYLKELFSNI